MVADVEDNAPRISIDDDVEWLTEQILALKELGQKDDVDDGQKYDFSIRWGTALAGRLPRLVYYSSRGLLDEADERRVQQLFDELKGLSDLIDRMGLVQPAFTEPTPAKSRRVRRLRRG
jgi:hypothetical protein